jgi:stage II sporulation protein D
MIEVGLAWDLDSLTLTPASSAEWAGSRSVQLETGQALFVRLRSGGFEAARSGREPEVDLLSDRDTARLTPSGPQPFVRWNGKTWRGQLKIFLSPRGTLTLVARVPLETYLLGVVPLEIGGLTPQIMEAGRAQAIAARSYTLYYMGRRGSEGFDLYGTVEDQVYGPIESERDQTADCVRSTRGEVALSAGLPIRANYSSTCGGISAEVAEAWPHPPERYLRSGLDRASSGPDFCRESPHYRWTEEWTVEEFLGNVERYASSFGVAVPAGWPGQLLDVRVESRSRSGRVKVLRVEGSAGDVIIPNHVLRQVLRRPGNRASILRSNLFKVAPRRDPNGRVLGVVVSGGGNGHGVGLCQSGALGMARAGHRAEQIMTHYYSGAEVKKLY